MKSQLFPETTLVLYGLLINLAWELAQSPLYADHARETSYVLWTRIHCTVGDGLILLGCFWLTALCFRTRFWFLSDRFFPTVVFVLFGVGYTIWSEWYNTQVAHSWAYTRAMPTFFGIGLSPVAQWLTIPWLLLLILRRRAKAFKESRNEKGED